MRWIARLEEARAGGLPLVWIAPPDAEGARPEAEDLADAAGLGPRLGLARLRRRALLRSLAAQVLELPPGAVRFSRAGARPRVVDPMALEASAAERDGWAVVALSPRPLGVDIERILPEGPPPLDLLAADERTRLATLPPFAQAEGFARLWVAKEAWAKATGTSLEAALRRPLVEPVETHRAGDYIAAAWEIEA